MNTPATLLLEEQLLQLQLAALHQHYRAQAQAATLAGWTYEAYLAALIQQEVDRRFSNRFQIIVSHHDRSFDDAVGIGIQPGHFQVYPDQIILILCHNSQAFLNGRTYIVSQPYFTLPPKHKTL